MKENVRILQIIHLAITLGTVLAYVFAGKIDEKILNFDTKILSGDSILFLLIPVVAIILSNFLYKSALGKIESNQNENEKLMVLKSASIIRWAVLEGAAFAILFLKPQFIIFGLIIIIYLIFVRPTENSVKNDLKIN